MRRLWCWLRSVRGMRTIERYLLLFIVVCVFVVVLLSWGTEPVSLESAGAGPSGVVDQSHGAFFDPPGAQARFPGSRNFLSNYEWSQEAASFALAGQDGSARRHCSMRDCFDFSRCHGRPFRVYVYPNSADPAGKKQSAVFAQILEIIRTSRFYTSRPEEACIFIPSLDTIDRDKRSDNFVQSVSQLLNALPLWNGGKNHVLFNLFSGTWPDYQESLGFDTGHAMLAKASIHRDNFRTGFDISIPLFLKEHPMRRSQSTVFERRGSLYPVHRRYLVSFKGKRYLSGIGTEVRNAVHHLHNGNDVIMLTTCKHGKSWQRVADERCAVDNALYDKYDYHDLLENSTFCLVPRGRRLGSFRFLETLFAACIPVSMSNGYVLPFDEVLDWKRAASDIDERRILELPSILRFASTEAVVQLRQQGQFLADSYFSSIEKIVMTTLEILRDRVNPQSKRGYVMWNSPPGGLLSLPTFAEQLHKYPFYTSVLRVTPNENYTAVILAHTPIRNSASPIIRLLKQLASTPTLEKVIVVWTGNVPPPKTRKWPKMSQPIEVVTVPDGQRNGVSRFISDKRINTDAILSLEEDTRLNVDEVNFAFRIWLDFPDRIVGYLARSHGWDADKEEWLYQPGLGNQYSMVLLNGAFYHKYYHHMVHEFLPPSVKSVLSKAPSCADIAFNFLVSYVTKHPPIKVAQKFGIRNEQPALFPQATPTPIGATYFNDPSVPETPVSLVYAQRQNCIRSFVPAFGRMPLSHSQMRLDPLLYRDNVSNSRKHYHRVGQR
ncbi:exostosin-1a-like [Sycon ciliatum]|uniref:exostosin-1a-like n=1 Tax=Sycon ciliatum TaxID=27933 RepID=UPI0020AC6C76|eukprot:scpid30585/ scgid30887/ Exostosin-1b; Glucuronosyl-N-acetylglucosaminyl-proteoglycan/N-acetylglucosaminyl-proteoglycan 4-alpha-N-acetylglucosaminyltransferase 1b; Multiple exostoses protein 1 homolog b